MKTTRSKLFELANNCRLGVSHLDDGFILDALEAFYRLAYTTGQKYQREKDANICEKYMRETGDMVARGCLVSAAYDIRNMPNED